MIKKLPVFFDQVLHVGRAAVYKVFGYTDVASKNQDVSTFGIV
jgi:hypothetical protein